jgi:hypothetical protein
MAKNLSDFPLFIKLKNRELLLADGMPLQAYLAAKAMLKTQEGQK